MNKGKKIITLENKIVQDRIERMFKNSTKNDLFLIRGIYQQLEKAMDRYDIRYYDLKDCKKNRVFGIRERKDAIYALFLTPYTLESSSDCDFDGNMRSSYRTEWVDSIGVLDTNLILVAWTQYFSWPISNVSKLYSDVTRVYDAQKINRGLAKKVAEEKLEREALNKSKEFIDRLGKSKIKEIK